MAIMSLGYLGLEAQDPTSGAPSPRTCSGCRFGTTTPMGAATSGSTRQRFRIAIHPGQDGALDYVGWELRDAEALECMLERLERHNVPHVRGSEEERKRRGVIDLIAVTDPAAHGTSCIRRRREPRDLPTDARRHRVRGPGSRRFGCRRPEDGRTVLHRGPRVQGQRLHGFPCGESQLSATFLRCADGREHSLALQDLGQGIHHALIEVASIDDVGKTLDICFERGVEIAESLGRHSNDKMISFYMVSPNGVQIECGFGGIHVDESTWRVRWDPCR